MRFGLYSGDMSLIARGDELGLDYLDISASILMPRESDADFAPVARQLRQTSVPIEAVGGFLPADLKIVGPVVDGEAVRRYVATVITRSSELGVKVITWGSAGSRSIPAGFSPGRAWSQLEAFCHLAADLAEPAGITIVIEPINPLEGNVLFYVSDALMLAQAINRPCIRVLADYYHMQMQNEPLEHIDRAAGWLAHAHTAGDGRHYPRPDDQWDQRQFFAALRSAGYDARVSLECLAREDAVAEVRAAIAHLRDVAAGL